MGSPVIAVNHDPHLQAEHLVQLLKGQFEPKYRVYASKAMGIDLMVRQSGAHGIGIKIRQEPGATTLVLKSLIPGFFIRFFTMSLGLLAIFPALIIFRGHKPLLAEVEGFLKSSPALFGEAAQPAAIPDLESTARESASGRPARGVLALWVLFSVQFGGVLASGSLRMTMVLAILAAAGGAYGASYAASTFLSAQLKNSVMRGAAIGACAWVLMAIMPGFPSPYLGLQELDGWVGAFIQIALFAGIMGYMAARLEGEADVRSPHSSLAVTAMVLTVLAPAVSPVLAGYFYPLITLLVLFGLALGSVGALGGLLSNDYVHVAVAGAIVWVLQQLLVGPMTVGGPGLGMSPAAWDLSWALERMFSGYGFLGLLLVAGCSAVLYPVRDLLRRPAEPSALLDADGAGDRTVV